MIYKFRPNASNAVCMYICFSLYLPPLILIHLPSFPSCFPLPLSPPPPPPPPSSSSTSSSCPPPLLLLPFLLLLLLPFILVFLPYYSSFFSFPRLFFYSCHRLLFLVYSFPFSSRSLSCSCTCSSSFPIVFIRLLPSSFLPSPSLFPPPFLLRWGKKRPRMIQVHFASPTFQSCQVSFSMPHPDVIYFVC